jgi:hypothetical protein
MGTVGWQWQEMRGHTLLDSGAEIAKWRMLDSSLVSLHSFELDGNPWHIGTFVKQGYSLGCPMEMTSFRLPRAK